MSTTRRTASAKLLLALQKPFALKIYRPTFRPAEWTKYLDQRALVSARKVTLECGTLEVGKVKVPIAVEFRRGRVVSVRPVGCAGCDQPKSPKPRGGRGLSEKFIRRVIEELRDRGTMQPLPSTAVKISDDGITIPLGDCTNLWIHKKDTCITHFNGTKVCAICLVMPSYPKPYCV